MSQIRQPKGIPVGGQFATQTHDEVDIALVEVPSTGEPAGTKVEGFELAFKQGSSDKFYRVFAWGDENEGHAVVQYGRAGTAGTIKATSYGSLDDAQAFAAKQLKAKKAKGYLAVGEAEFDVDADSMADIANMDLDTMFRTGRTATTELVANATADEQAAHAAAIERAAALAAESDYVPTATLADINAGLSELGLTRRSGKTMEAIPQLAETIPKAELGATLDNPNYVTQPKLDGDRFMVHIDNGEVRVLNRHGQPKKTNVSGAVVASFAPFTEGTWNFDGEMVGRTLHVFDMGHAEGFVDADSPFEDRHAALAAVVSAMDSPHVRLVGCSSTDGADKRKMLQDIKERKGEGIILRSRHATYKPGTRGHGLLKHKFVSEADVYVKSVDPSKESVTLAVRDASGKERIVGKASTIGKGTIGVGDVVEAQFAHVLDPDNPVMVQPRIMRKRTDKSAGECSIDQFADAGTIKDVDAQV